MDKISSPQGHYSRLRQRFLSAGIDVFLDYEVVELLLKIKGIGDPNIFGLKLVQSVARRYLKEQIIGECFRLSPS